MHQDLAYHRFADNRSLFDIANFYNVMSNIPFMLVGLAGAFFCARQPVFETRGAWLVFFAGIALVGPGSLYYHLDPDNQGLFWDRLPMVLGFMGLFTALLGELLAPKSTRYLLLPMLLLGLASVLIWHRYDDLRLYLWVQFMPMLVIPVMLLLYPKRYSHSYLLVAALVMYALAKLFEVFDVQVFSLLQNAMGGHAIKHVMAALGGACALWMLQIRKPL